MDQARRASALNRRGPISERQLRAIATRLMGRASEIQRMADTMHEKFGGSLEQVDGRKKFENAITEIDKGLEHLAFAMGE